MQAENNEPDDNKVYNLVSLYAETVRFLTKSLQFYHALLNKDLDALVSDKDLKDLLESEPTRASVLRKEITRVKRAIEWFERIQDEQGRESFDYEIGSFTHGVIRFLKSVGLLYLSHLQQRRNTFASRSNLSKYVIEDLDNQLSKYREKLETAGVFGLASAIPLLVDEITPSSVSDEVSESVAATESSTASLATTKRPRPVLLESIQLLDTALKERCLDLFNDFTEKRQHSRFDTVIVEATRILEDRLRTKMQVEGHTGDELAVLAFGSKPKLRVSDVEAEQQAVLLFFKGIFGYIRNPPHHKLLGELSPERTLQILALLDYAIHIVESATKE